MADYISREDALMAVTRAKLPDTTPDGVPIANGKRSVTDCVRRIKAIPSADVAEVRHGTWEERNVDDPYDTYGLFRRRFYCSACGQWTSHGKTAFCPHCGAKMRCDDE